MNAVVNVERTWSAYQNAIFAFVETGAGNAVVEAVAGSGKTTTIVEAMRRAGGDSVFLAFNKSIAGELCARGVNAKTFHGLCFSPVQHFLGGKLNADKLRDIIFDAIAANAMTSQEGHMYGAFMKKLVGLARQIGVGCLVADEPSVWFELVATHELEIEAESADIDRGVELARKLLDAANASNDFDFDDMLYRVVRDGIRLPVFDFICVDEAQDTNAIQREILRKIMHGGSRLIAVGDPAQAIYGFRGADSSSLERITSEFECTRLPLTVSYRCPTSVVAYAQRWVSHIEAAPSAPEGSVTTLDVWSARDFRISDMVVCRTTAPLTGTAYALLRAKVPVKVLGKEIGQGLKSLIEKMNTTGVERLTEKLEAYRDREVKRATEKGDDQKAAGIADKVESILCLIEGLVGEQRTVPGLLRLIDTLFADTKNAVTLATIHKSKGLEAKRVFWLDSSRCPSKWAKQDWQIQQEMNLCYVAVTRAQQELIMIESDARGY